MKNGPCRLLEELLLKEKEYQQVLKATLQQRSQDLELARVRHRPSGTQITHHSPWVEEILYGTGWMSGWMNEWYEDG